MELCPECGGIDREAVFTKYGRSDVPDGRLRLHDVSVRQDVICADCGHTFASVVVA